MTKYGKKTWLIPDAFYNSVWHGQVSHESVCVINTSDENAKVHLTLLFEDRDKMDDFYAECKPGRTHHIRMDKQVSASGKTVPQDVPYAILVESNVEIVVQYSRLDTSQSEMALMSVIAYSEE